MSLYLKQMGADTTVELLPSETSYFGCPLLSVTETESKQRP